MLSLRVVTLGSTLALAAAHPARAGDLETLGDLLQFAIPASAAAISVYKHDTDGLWQLGATTVATAGFTHALKFSFNETDWGRRPHGGDDSFPSGHTSSAFSGAGYLHFRYGWEYGLPAAALATVVGYSRVEADKHHVRDVVAGALVGYGTAFLLTDAQNENVTILPYAEITKPSFGFVARIQF